MKKDNSLETNAPMTTTTGGKTGGIMKMTTSIKKSVKISDDGFLKSTKDFLASKKQQDIIAELSFLVDENAINK